MSVELKKRVLVPGRLRRLPREGWSWIDRRFMRAHAPKLGHDAIALYFFYAAVADKNGVSYYGDGTIAGLLKVGSSRIAVGRDELVTCDLIAYMDPTVQVLALATPPCRAQSTPVQIGDLLRLLTRGES
jgi:hypothetical protein